MRERNLFDFGDLAAPKGSPAWVKAVHYEAMNHVQQATRAAEHAAIWLAGLAEDDRWRQCRDENGRLFSTWEAYCSARQPFGLGYRPDVIAAIRALAALR